MLSDKQAIKTTLLELERQDIAQAQAAYEAFASGAYFDAEQTIEDDDLAQAITQRNLADEADTRVHEHLDHAAQIEAIDFDPKTTIEPGAVVKLDSTERYLVIAIATSPFECDGLPFLGISTDAPLYEAIAGLSAGDTFEFRGRERTVEKVG